jgi:DNA-directed RNA polymerase subunit RPC12/RpoP
MKGTNYDCPTCGFPIMEVSPGERIQCSNCQTGLIMTDIGQEVSIPAPVIVGLLGFVLGVIVGPALLAATDEGSRFLARQARAKLAS